MILITIVFKNIIADDKVVLTNSNKVSIEVKGHSGSGTKGTDIVCSAVSALTQTYVLTVARLLKIEQSIIKSDGVLQSLIFLDNISDEAKSDLKLLIESLLIGLFEINSEYPDKIRIEFIND